LAPVGESWELRVLAPKALGKYLAYKGSITVNGVSLTVNPSPTCRRHASSHQPDPAHRAEHRAGQPGSRQPGQLEIDLIARYVERMLSAEPANAKASQ
jgi:riboflavin synthase